MSAEAAGLGFGEFLLVIGPLSFFSGLGRQRDSLLFTFLRCCPFSGSFLFGIVCSRARLFLLASSLGAMVSIDEKLSFRMVYPRRTGANGLRQECRGVIADCCRATLAAARVDARTEKNRTDSEFILQRMADSETPGSQPVQSGPLRKKQRFAERKPEPVPKPLDTYTNWRQRMED